MTLDLKIFLVSKGHKMGVECVNQSNQCPLCHMKTEDTKQPNVHLNKRTWITIILITTTTSKKDFDQSLLNDAE